MEKLSVVEAKKKELLKLSKKKGYITAESLNTIFEDDSITSEEIDELYTFLKDNEIDIVTADLNEPDIEIEEKTKKEKKNAVTDTTPIRTMDERKENLLKIGKAEGFLTFEQLANELKGLEMDAESLDDLYNFLRDNNIEVIEEGEDTEGGEDLGDLDFDESTLPKNLSINDPVRMYLKEIGRISL